MATTRVLGAARFIGTGTVDPPAGRPVLDRMTRARLTLAAHAERVPLARAFLGEVLGCRHPCAETAVLLASELVTNSVRHSGCRHLGQTITVTAVVTCGEVRIEVTDSSGRTVPAVHPSGEVAEGGRGLQLVQALAASWGYWRDGGRTTTWFVCIPPSLPARRIAGAVAGWRVIDQVTVAIGHEVKRYVPYGARAVRDALCRVLMAGERHVRDGIAVAGRTRSQAPTPMPASIATLAAPRAKVR